MCCWSVASDSQTEEAKLYIERYIMSRIYMQAMFPNGDADVLRDQYVSCVNVLRIWRQIIP